MSHLKNKGRNRWQICLDLGEDPSTGKRLRKYKTVKGNKAEAEAVMAEMLGRISKHQTIDESEMTLEEYMEMWHHDIRHDIEISTHRTYRTIVNDVARHLGKIRLKDLKPYHCKKYVTEMVDRGLSKSTIADRKGKLAAALNAAVKEYQLIPTNPALHIPTPKMAKEKKEVVFLERWEAEEFIDRLGLQHLKDFCTIALHTGMRRNEIVGLRWSDIDWKKEIIHVNRSIGEDGQNLYEKGPKSKAGKRTITIWPESIHLLKAIKKRRLEEKIFFGKAYEDNDLVICHPDGRLWHGRYITIRFRAWADKLEYPDLTPHSLRHSHAAICIKAGIPLELLQDRLGHEKFSTTKDTYGHILPSMREDYRDVFRSAFT